MCLNFARCSNVDTISDPEISVSQNVMFSFTLLTLDKDDPSFKASLMVFDNEIRILADPGWNGENPDDALFMEKHLGDVGLILLSQSTPEFIGGYILLCIKFPHLMAAIPVYATVAVSQLGRVSTVEFYRARGHLGPLQSALMEVSDVDEWFDKMILVKYFQNMTVLENRIVLTAYNSGHTLGGSFWLITKRLEKIIYAPTWNHSKDSFLNSASFLSATTGNPIASLLRPSAIITSTELGSTMSHKKRTEKFLNLIDGTLANGGAVLLPTTISGRFLELLRIVDEHLANLQGAAIPVYFLSYSGTKVLSYASNLLDWMSSQLIKEYEGIAAEDRAYSRVPFEPSKVDLLLEPQELIQLPGPKIVFASGLEIKDGDMSSQAMQLLCQNEKTTIILTEKSSFAKDNTCTTNLFQEWYTLASAKNNGVAEDGIPVPLEKAIPFASWTREEPLKDSELQSFKEKIAQYRRQKLLSKVQDKKNKNILNADLSSDDSSSSDDELSSDDEDKHIEANVISSANTNQQGDAASVLNSHEVFVTDYVTESLEANKPVDTRVSYKLKPRQAMFPFFPPAKKRKHDEYGEVIDPKDFQKSDENSANNKLISESKKNFELNDKGKWGDLDDFERGRRNHKRGRDGHLSNANKLTPQEILNNQLLQKSLDTLFRPVKRVPARTASVMASHSVELKVRCGLSFIDLAGLVDLRSLNMIMSTLRPHNLILLPDFSFSSYYDPALNGLLSVGNAFRKQLEDQKMKTDAESVGSSSNFDLLTLARKGLSRGITSQMSLFTAVGNMPLEIGNKGHGSLNEFEVKLDETLDSSLAWQKIDGNYRVSHVKGELEINKPESETFASVDELINSSTKFVLRPVSNSAQQKFISSATDNFAQISQGNFGPALAIGDIRLPELKKKLLSRELSAEFKSEGTLVVNNTIAIRKIALDNQQGGDTGDIAIEGQIGPLYYEVKKCIREMLAYV